MSIFCCTIVHRQVFVACSTRASLCQHLVQNANGHGAKQFDLANLDAKAGLELVAVPGC